MFFYLFIYFLSVCFSITFWHVFSKSQSVFQEVREYPLPTKFFLGFISSILIVVSCLRYGIGTDYFLYQRLFTGNTLIWEKVDARLLFKFSIDFFNRLHLPFQVFVSFFSFFSLFLLFKVIYKKSKNPFLSIAIFMGSSLYSFSLSGFRQFAAIVLVLYSSYLYTRTTENSKYNKFICLGIVIIAFSIHMTALPAAIIFYLVYLWKPSIKTVQILCISAIPITVITRIGLGLVNKVFILIVTHSGYYSGYSNYLSNNMGLRLLSKGISLYNLILLIPLLYFIFFMLFDYVKGNYHLSSFNLFIIKISLCCELFYSLNMSSEIINRFIMYFSISSLFLFPEIVAYCNWKWGRRISIVTLLGFLALITFMYFRNLSSNIYDIVPYISVFANR